jgi:acetyl esterase/lipase
MMKRRPPARLVRPGGAEYAMRLTAAGNRVSYVLFSRQIHGFVPIGKMMDEATRRSRCDPVTSRNRVEAGQAASR